MLGQGLAAARSNDQDLVSAQRAAVIAGHRDSGGFEVGSSTRVAHVQRLAAWTSLPGRGVGYHVPQQTFRGGIVFRAPRHVQLTKQDHPAALTILQQRTVLQTEPAVDERQKVAASRLLDQDRGHVAAVPTSPQPRDFQSAPAHRRGPVVSVAGCAHPTRRNERRRAPPVAQMLVAKSSQDRMSCDSRPDGAEPVFLDAEAQPLLQDLRSLFEDQDLEPVRNSPQVGCRPLGGQRGFADHQQVISSQIGPGVDGLAFDAERRQLLARLAEGVEHRHFPRLWWHRSGRQDMNLESIHLLLARHRSQALRGTKLGRQCQFVAAGRQVGRQDHAHWDPQLLAGFDPPGMSPTGRLWQGPRPGAFATHRNTGIVDQDDLLLDLFARQEVVVLAGELIRFAPEVCQQRPVVAQHGFRGRRGDPVGRVVGQVHALVSFLDVVRTKARPLQVLPVRRQLDASIAVHAGTQLPKHVMLPRRDRGHAPAAKGPPVVRQVLGQDGIAFVKVAGAQLVRIVPAMPQPPAAELVGLPPQVSPLLFADPIRRVTEELGVPFRQAEFPRHGGAAELATALKPAAVHGPIPGERGPVLAGEKRLHPDRRPVLEPVGQFLDRYEIRVKVARVHRTEVTRRVMIDDPAGVQPPQDRLGLQSAADVVHGPLVALVVNPVDCVGVHVFVVAGGVVAGGVHHHGRMRPGDADVERRVLGIAIGPVGVGGLPVVIGKVRLRQRHQHPQVVGGPQDFLKSQVRARLATVVVRVHKVDAKALQAFQALSGSVVRGQGGPDLRVVQRHRTQEDAAPIQVEIPALDPEFAKPKRHRMGGIQDLASAAQQ